jgi:pSer/pThr/pTyr-binding forkhead associated (FHA) protein
VKLVFEDAAGTRSTVAFTGDEIVVGRGTEGNAVRLSGRNVSRRHARFLRQGASVSVEDLGSLVGTRVNGERIQGRRKLRAGDVVEIGDHDVAVQGDEASHEAGAPPPLPPVTTPRPETASRLLAAEPARTATRPLQPRIDKERTRRYAAIAAAVALLAGLAVGWGLSRRLASAAPAAAVQGDAAR